MQDAISSVSLLMLSLVHGRWHLLFSSALSQGTKPLCGACVSKQNPSILGVFVLLLSQHPWNCTSLCRVGDFCLRVYPIWHLVTFTGKCCTGVLSFCAFLSVFRLWRRLPGGDGKLNPEDLPRLEWRQVGGLKFSVFFQFKSMQVKLMILWCCDSFLNS